MPLLPRSMTMGVHLPQALQSWGAAARSERVTIRKKLFMATILGIDERKREGLRNAASIGIFARRPVHTEVDGAAVSHGAVANLKADASYTDGVATLRRKRSPAIVAAQV